MHQKFNFRLELKITPLLHTSFYTTRMHSIYHSMQKSLKKKLVREGATLGTILPHPWADLATITLVGDHEYFIPTKFPQNPSSSSGEEVENDLA